MLTFTDDEFKRQVQDETGIKPEWAAEAFGDLDEDVRQSIARIKASPFIPRKDGIRGFVYEVETGKLRETDDCIVFVVRGGRIVETDFYFDSAATRDANTRDQMVTAAAAPPPRRRANAAATRGPGSAPAVRAPRELWTGRADGGRRSISAGPARSQSVL
jgi:hypothetical protein